MRCDGTICAKVIRQDKLRNERGNKTQHRRKWVTQYMLCSAKLSESSKPGRTRRDKGCHVDLGIFRTVLLLWFRSLWVRCIKGKYVSGLDYRHNPSDDPAARHPAQPTLNRRLRWEVEDCVWTDGLAGKLETEAKRAGCRWSAWVSRQKSESVTGWKHEQRIRGKNKVMSTDRKGLKHLEVPNSLECISVM